MRVNHEHSTDAPTQLGVAPGVRRGVKALIRGSERVLLLRERHGDGRAFWTLPGGGIEDGERPVQALHRELAEELQCRGIIGPPVDRYAYPHTSCGNLLSVYTVYECAVTAEPTPNASEGVDQCRWVRPDDLPPRTLPQVRALL